MRCKSTIKINIGIEFFAKDFRKDGVSNWKEIMNHFSLLNFFI